MKFNPNDLRLFAKTLVTAWVPIAVVSGLVNWNAEFSVMVMAASTITIDGFFRIFGVKEAITEVNVQTETKVEKPVRRNTRGNK